MSKKSKVRNVGRESFEFVGYTIELRSEMEGGELFVCANCPVCGKKEDSSDHNITKGKIRTHMRLIHKDEVGDEKNAEPSSGVKAG